MATDPLPLNADDFRRYQRMAIGAGVAGLALCAAGYFWSAPVLLRSYLWAYLFWLGIALGSLVLGLLQWLTGGVWGLVLRRVFEAAAQTLPLLAVLFLPIALGTRHLYVWAEPDYFTHGHGLEFKRWYLSLPRFAGFAAAYFIIWSALAFLMSAWSVREDQPDRGDPRNLRKVAAAGLVLYGVTITLAAVDWVMSLEPRWFSSIFGALLGIGQVLSAFSFSVICVLLLGGRPPLAALLGRPLLRDFGSLLLAFVMVWAYLSFSQLLLIWSGNLPAEIVYYQRRSQGGWQVVAALLAVLHFALPFALLLSAEIKRSRPALLRVATLILAMRCVDLYWLVTPAYPGSDGRGYVGLALNETLSWTDVAAPIGIGGVWLALFLWLLQRRPLVPSHDPQLHEAYHHE